MTDTFKQLIGMLISENIKFNLKHFGVRWWVTSRKVTPNENTIFWAIYDCLPSEEYYKYYDFSNNGTAWGVHGQQDLPVSKTEASSIINMIIDNEKCN